MNKIIETREASTGQITVRKEVDKATPLLMKAALDARRAEVKGEIEKRHVELKTKLAAFKNKVKAEIAGRIADNLTKLNERLTDQMAAQIDKMKNIMARVAAGDVNGDGAADIAAANTAIADAAAAVTAQAGKTYTVNVTTEAKIKVDVGAARQQLHDDLKVVEDKMQAARQAVRKAVADVLKLAPSASVNASGSVITQ